MSLLRVVKIIALKYWTVFTTEPDMIDPGQKRNTINRNELKTVELSVDVMIVSVLSLPPLRFSSVMNPTR